MGEGFVAWGPDSPVPVLKGGQGLQHIWVSLRTKSPNVSAKTKAKVTLKLLRKSSGTPIAPGTFLMQLPFKPVANGWLQYEGVPAVVYCPCTAMGQQVVIDATIHNSDPPLHGQAVVVPTWAHSCTPLPASCTKT